MLFNHFETVGFTLQQARHESAEKCSSRKLGSSTCWTAAVVQDTSLPYGMPLAVAIAIAAMRTTTTSLNVKHDTLYNECGVTKVTVPGVVDDDNIERDSRLMGINKTPNTRPLSPERRDSGAGGIVDRGTTGMFASSRAIPTEAVPATEGHEGTNGSLISAK
ncbi:hypothetical protein C8035_v006766 [Colletotrichum spinosum]|uniref:Uncharacterized protein n=1 Tax=Colletotrichum spinosum TaxID=1347390 RepID=A0A4R8QUG6_9PEZI|nr:hypothetical protein C8035_v006766 [Colletotrichum spinosum]